MAHSVLTRDTLAVSVRWMIRRDLATAVAIARDSFADAWAEDEFLYRLRQRNCISLVAEHGDLVVGYCVYEIYDDRLDVVALAVAPRYRRRGVGTRLVAKLLGKMNGHRRARLTAVAPERAAAALLLFRGLGLRAVRLLRGHYGDEDGIEMVYDAQPEPEDV